MQTRTQSIVESLASTAIGFVIALVTQMLVAEAFNLGTTTGQDIAITAIFTAISIARGYCVRRVFNRLHSRGES